MRKRRGGKKTHGQVILLDSIKFPNNFLFKKSLRTCIPNNCVKKKSNNIYASYVKFTDIIQFIQYTRMY